MRSDKISPFPAKFGHVRGCGRHTMESEVIMRISSYIAKPVISPEGAAYGYVKDVRLSPAFDRLSSIVCVDGDEEEFYLPLRTVKAVSDALIVGKARLTQATGIPSPVGKPVYDCAANRLGAVSDVILGEGEAVLVITGEGGSREAPLRFAQLGETVVLYPEEVKRRAKTASGATSHTAARNAARKPRPSAAARAVAAPSDGSPSPEEPVWLNRTNLLGKYLKRTVYDKAGAPIALEGQKITPAVLSSARRAGRLLALTVCTLTK